MIDVKELLDEFEHECVTLGGTPRVKKGEKRIYAYCDLGELEATLEYVKGEETYTLSFNVVSDSVDDIFDYMERFRD